MKKGKYLFLLAAVLSMLFIFVACDGETETEAPSDTDKVVETVTDAESTGETDVDTTSDTETKTPEETTAPHEIHNYFDILQEKSDIPLDDVSRIDGQIDAYYPDDNLAVISKKDLDTMNNVVHTIDVVDLITGETLMTKSISNPYGASYEDVTTLKIEVDYPIIRVEKKYYEEVGEGFYLDYDTKYSVEYYLAEKDGELLHTTDKTYWDVQEFGNGLVRAQLANEIKWIDKNLDVIRTVKTIASTGYDVESFDFEYKGYMYTSTDTKLMIFNRSGICCAIYTADDNSEMNYFVLNNGNVLVQEITPVSNFESCDFVLNGNRFILKSSIVNFVNGETTEIELGFLVDSLETKYYQKAVESNALILKKGYENYATVYNVANGSIAKHADLVVVSNELEVLFTFSNDAEGVDLAYDDIWYVTDDYYAIYVDDYSYVGGYAIFDYYGELISYVVDSAEMIGNGYFVTANGIYDVNMDLVIDLLAEGYSDRNNGFFSKMNYKTGGEEYYLFSAQSEEMKMVADGVDMTFVDSTSSIYVLYDVENDVYVAYNMWGDELVVSYEELTLYDVNDEFNFISTNLDGKSIIYIVK